MKKELLVYLSIFLILTLLMHYKEFLEYPIEHLKNLSISGAYGLGFTHPFVFTLLIYILISIPRFIIKLLKRKP